MRIEEAFNMQGYVTNQNIQKTLKVARFRAVRIAKRLIDLGLVEKTTTTSCDYIVTIVSTNWSKFTQIGGNTKRP